MAKEQKQQTKTCSDCIHENACRIWTDGRFISDESASGASKHETEQESAPCRCDVWDERTRHKDMLRFPLQFRDWGMHFPMHQK